MPMMTDNAHARLKLIRGVVRYYFENRYMKYFLAAFLLLTQMTLSHAADAAKADDYSQMRQNLAKVMANVKPDSIKPSPIEGLYEVVYGAQIYYATKDGSYLVQGDILDVNGQSNVTELHRTGARLSAINKVSEDKMIIFAPQKVKHTVTVFTDIDCGYCRKLHSEIDTYLKEGIRVRYLSMPRAGLNSPSYTKAVAVWCAKDRKDALTRAKKDEAVEQKTCDNPVKEEMQLAQEVGVSGTPTIITDTGRLLPGYVPAAHLAQMLEEDSKRN
jgi:thiol:disulfide interchange protein DsbC